MYNSRFVKGVEYDEMNVDAILELDVGDIFYEFGYGSKIECTVVTKPVLEEKELTWEASALDGDGDPIGIDYLITKGDEHYGPTIYRKI